MPSEATLQSLSRLRDASHLSWLVIPMLLVVIYVYAQEVERGNLRRVLAALAFWGMDWFNEIWNGLVFHFTQFAPVWGIAGDTSYLILLGLNIEITFMFAISGVVATLGLPQDARLRWWGINNRIWLAIVFSALSVCVEVLLHRAGILVWDWPWWNAQHPWGIFLLGYLPFYLVCYWVYDRPTVHQQLMALAVIYGVDMGSLCIFGGMLNWL